MPIIKHNKNTGQVVADGKRTVVARRNGKVLFNRLGEYTQEITIPARVIGDYTQNFTIPSNSDESRQ